MGFSGNGESGTVWPVRIAMKDFGPHGVLTTREAGDAARQQMLRGIDSLTPGDPVAFDFEDVEAISVPFAEQSIGLLLAGRLGGYLEDHPLLALNASEDVRETLAAALRPRRLALLSLSPDQRPELLGGDQVLRDTLLAAHRLGPEFSVVQLADDLGITVQAANNRLRALLHGGALSRLRIVPTRGGKEFRYTLPQIPQAQRSRGGTTGGRRPRRSRQSRASV